VPRLASRAHAQVEDSYPVTARPLSPVKTWRPSKSPRSSTRHATTRRVR